VAIHLERHVQRDHVRFGRALAPGDAKQDLYNYSLQAIFLVGLAAILAAIEIGHLLGVRATDRSDGNVSKLEDDNFSTLESAVLGLLALMIAFTFAMALSRFETRRDAILSEANAIGTTALRARLCAFATILSALDAVHSLRHDGRVAETSVVPRDAR
jgi:hypothetical protein